MPGADLADEVGAGQRRERGGDLVLELAAAVEQALALDDVEVRHRGGAAGRVAGVRLAVAEPEAAPSSRGVQNGSATRPLTTTPPSGR